MYEIASGTLATVRQESDGDQPMKPFPAIERP